MNKYFSALLFFSGIVAGVSAQTSSNERQATHITRDTLQGSYEIIQNDNKLTQVFTTDILDAIEKARDDKEIKYLQLGPNTTVKIYPRSAMNIPIAIGTAPTKK